MSQSRKPSLFGRRFGRSEMPSQGPSDAPTDNSFVQEQMKEELSFDQQLRLQQVQDEMFCLSLNKNSPLRGFEKGYHETLQSFQKQLAEGRFEDPETITRFTTLFAEKYVGAKQRAQEEKELLIDPWSQEPRPEAPTKGPPSYPEWKKTMALGEQLQSSPLPTWAVSGLQTMIGARTHISRDLQPSLDTAFREKQARSPGAKREDLEKDFQTGGKPFRETTRKTGEALGIPSLFTTIGESMVGVERQRDDQFAQWKERGTE
jgi:hypothetical protein